MLLPCRNKAEGQIKQGGGLDLVQGPCVCPCALEHEQEHAQSVGGTARGHHGPKGVRGRGKGAAVRVVSAKGELPGPGLGLCW